MSRRMQAMRRLASMFGVDDSDAAAVARFFDLIVPGLPKQTRQQLLAAVLSMDPDSEEWRAASAAAVSHYELPPVSATHAGAGASGQCTVHIKADPGESTEARISEILSSLRSLSPDVELKLSRRLSDRLLLTLHGSPDGLRKIQALSASDLSIELRARVLGVSWDSPMTPEARDVQRPTRSSGDVGHGTRVFCGNMSPSTTEADLLALFSKYGDVTSIQLVMDLETGMSRGFAFIEMASSDSAQLAIQGLNGARIDDRVLRVAAAPARDTRGGGGYSGGYSGGGTTRW